MSPVIACLALAGPADEPRLRAELTPPATVAGDTSTVHIELRGLNDASAAASTGSIDRLSEGLQLNIGDDRAPRVISIALAAKERAGAVFLVVRGRTQLPVEIAGRASIEVEVGTQRFGPFATAGGRLEVPIEVSPGAQSARVIATDDFGNTRFEDVDLKPPRRSRLALVAPHPRLPLGATTHIAIAYAHADGTPGTEQTAVTVTAQRGRAGAAVYRGDGLWVASYHAAAEVGTDAIEVRVSDGGDESRATLELTVALPEVARVGISLPGGKHQAGSKLVGTVWVRDANGVAITSIPPTVELGDQALEVKLSEDVFTFAVALPKVVPDSGSVVLVATAGEARDENRVRLVAPQPEPPAELPASQEAELALGARVFGGYWNNLGSLSGPRAGVSMGVRADTGPVELALLVGAEYAAASTVARTDGRRVDHEVDVLGFSMELRARYALGDAGVALAAVVAPTAVRVRSITSEQPDEVHSGIRGAVRAAVSGDYALGPSRVYLALSLGHATLPEGVLGGPFERFAVLIGYEYWLLGLFD